MKLIRGGTVWLGHSQGAGRGQDHDAGNNSNHHDHEGFQPGIDILIEGSRIAAVGADLASQAAARGADVIDAAGRLVLPGFVNAHTHAAMTLLRSYADDLPLQEWLTEKIWPVEARLTGEDVYWGTLLGIVEMIRAGVTTCADMYFFLEDVARAVQESGIRASLANGLFDGPSWNEHIRAARAFAETWHGGADGRIQVMFGPHSPYATLNGLRDVAKAAKELELPVHIHLSETRREVEESLATHNLTPIAVAEREGLLDGSVLAAHCVHVSPEDLELMSRHDVRVVHNPTSNMKLGSGKAPVQQMLDRGILVALGTDGASSNNNLDLLEEARLASFLAKMDGAPADLAAPTCLEMATVYGARALDFADVGALAPGRQADIILISTAGPHWAPPFDPCANLIYSGNSRDVTTVLVAGEVVMDKGVIRTLDEERVLKEAAQRGFALVGRSDSGAAGDGETVRKLRK